MLNKAFYAALLVTAGMGLAAADVQFYKPNRAARLVVTLKSKSTYKVRPVIVTVMLTNQGNEPLLINRRMRFNRYPLDGEIAFVIEGPKKKAFPLIGVVSPRDITDADLAILKPGETMEQEADLTKMYGLINDGAYRVQAIYYNALQLEKTGLKTWTGNLASEPTEITLK